MIRLKVWQASHGPAHVAAHASGREYAPRRAAVRAALSVLLLVLVMLSSPTYALAATAPEVDYSNDGNFIVAPVSNGFDAALAVLGLQGTKSSLTDEMKAKLTNESTGGAFYQLAMMFSNTVPVVADPAYGFIVVHDELMYGSANVMYATGVTNDIRADAHADYNTIRNGGSLGGGGVVDDGTYIVFSGNTQYIGMGNSSSSSNNSCVVPDYDGNVRTPRYYYQATYNMFNSDSYEKLPEVLTVKVKKTIISNLLESCPPENYSYYINLQFGNDGAAKVKRVSALNKQSVTPTENLVANDVYKTTSYISSVSYSSGGKSASIGSSYHYTYSNGIITIDGNTAITSFTNYNTTGTVSSVGQLLGTGSGGGGGNLTDNWPHDVITGHPVDEPVVPTPPDYEPITYTNPTDDPLPTPPPETPYTPVTPIVTTDPTNTTPQDYTPWLSAILTELRNFHRDAIGIGNNLMDALSTHCTHITTTIMDETEWLYNQLKAQIRAGVQAILDGLDQNCTEMMDYLQDLAEWLADQLQFTFNIDNSYNPEISVPAYDDGSVVAWLQRIYNAIRSIKGPTIGTPVTEKDIDEGFDWWAWILSLLDQLFDNVISQTVGDVEQFLDEFKDLFPLSIPWDVVAILTMFAGTPTTPEVTLTFPAIASLGLPEYDVEIDLEPFDNAAATIRQAEQIVFAFYLLFKTQWLLDTLKSATDAAGEFVEGLLT